MANLRLLDGVVWKQKYEAILNGERMKSVVIFNRVANQLKGEMWETQEVLDLLDAIRPIAKPIVISKK